MTEAAVEALLRPRSIVILGASDRSRWSRIAFDNLREGGFGGAVHLVNRRGGQVHGQAAAESVAGLGEAPDLGLVLVPAEAVAEMVRDLGAAGARSAVILTSGFAELGAAGASVQNSVADAARRAGVRLLGPNSLGFVNFADGVHAWTTPVRAPTRQEGVAIVSQSGATAYFLSTLAWRQDVGLSHVVATGNEADLDLAAISLSLLHHPATRALALFVETLRDPAGFLALAQAALAARKPLVVLKVGVSEVTAKSALAHTGALVGDDRVFDGICAQYGIIRARSVEELLTTADVMGRAGALRPGGLGIVSNSGGICEIAADSAAARGLVLPELSLEAVAVLRETIPGFATPHNPLDLTGAITPEQCEAVVDIVAAQPALSAVLCPYYEVPTEEADMSERLSGLHAALAAGLSRAPVPGFVVSYTGTHLSPLSKRIVAATGMPYLACGLDLAVTALAGASCWSERLRQPPATTPAAPAPEPERPRSEHEALRCLARHGVPVVPAVLAQDAEQAVQAAAALDGEVVLKIASPDIGHKSDMGGVALGLRGGGGGGGGDTPPPPPPAATAHEPQAAVEGVLVAPMRPRGIELFVGVTRDPQWGAVLAVGLGGVWVEVLKDVALRLLPVDAAEARRMLEGLRGAAMLAGQRGVPAADLDAVAATVARIGDVALAFGPELAALDVNPLWVRGDRVEALDALCVWQDAAG